MLRLFFLATFALAFMSVTQYGLAYAETAANEDMPADPILIVVNDEGLSEPDLKISAGRTVIWSNLSSEYVVIFFAQGKEVELVCESPTRFYLSADDTFTSGLIPPNAVASLCLRQPGEYRYFSVYGGTGRQVKGMITVE